MDRIELMKVFGIALILASSPLIAAKPDLETYEITRLDMRGDLIRDIEIHPVDSSIVYLVGQNGGVYKSVDAGATWQHLLAIDGRGLGIDPRHPDTVYAGGFGGVYKTVDGGRTWARVLEATLRSVGVHPVSGVVFGGGNGGAIWRSEDGGKTWTQPASATNGEINKWAFHAQDANIAYHSAAKNRGVYKSTDGGKTWREVLKEYGRAVAISPSHPNILYSSQHKSVDGGETWTSTGGSQAWAVAIHPRNPDIVYKASQGDAVFMTVNGGRHWTQMKGLTRGGPTDLTAHWSIAIDGMKDVLYVGAAVLYKADGASSQDARLHESCRGLQSPDVVSIAGTPEVLWIGTDGQGVARSTDSGRSWERRLLGLRGKLNLGALVIHPLNHQVIYSAGEGGLVKSSNGGRIWLHMPHPGGSVRSVAVDPRDPEGVFTVTDQKLHHSRDGGFNWREWEATKGLAVSSLAIHPLQPLRIYIQTDAGWRRSDDGGKRWQSVVMPGKGSLVLSQNASTPDLCYFAQDRKFIHKSADGGATWALLTEVVQFRGLAEAPDGVLWMADRSVVMRSFDGGASWETRDAGVDIRRLLVDPRNPRALFLAAKGGLFWLHPSGTELPPGPPPPPPAEKPRPATIPVNAAGILDRPNTVYELTADIKARGTAFYVTADDVTLDGRGFRVTFDISAVEAYGASNLVVRNVKAVQAPTGPGSSHGISHAFDLMFCPGATLTGLTIDTQRRAVSAISVSGDHPTVAGNVVSRSGPFATAINVEGRGARILDNQIDASNSGRGIAVADAADALVVSNRIVYGGAHPISGMSVSVAPGARIEGNTLRGRGHATPALDVRFSEGVKLIGNDIESSSPLLRLAGSSGGDVRRNRLNATGPNPAIELDNTDNARIEDNAIATVADTRVWVSLAASRNNRFSGNRWNGISTLPGERVAQDEASKDNLVPDEKQK